MFGRSAAGRTELYARRAARAATFGTLRARKRPAWRADPHTPNDRYDAHIFRR
jgi:hypothetical protein